MIVIKENNRVYVVDSIYHYTRSGLDEQMLVPENMPITKAKHSPTVIAGLEYQLDPLRYIHLPFPKELSHKALADKIVPEIKDILHELGRDDEDGDIHTMAFAKGNKAFIVYAGKSIVEIAEEEAFGAHDDQYRYALSVTRGMPLAARLQAIYKAMGSILGANMFPLMMMDTVGLKINIVEENRQ